MTSRQWSRSALVAFGLLLAPLALVAAQEGSGNEAEQEAAESARLVARAPGYLTDGEGRSLYVYVEDGRGRSVCYERCAENWPPFTVADEREAEALAGTGVLANDVGTIERDDGSLQVTYGGWPLYRYAFDQELGDVHGHRLGDVFYLMGPSGRRIVEQIEVDVDAEEADDPAAAEGQVGEPEEAEDDADGDGGEGDGAESELGAEVFANQCATCHGEEGQGVTAPGLDGNGIVERTGTLLSTIMFGRPDHGMPAFAEQLSNEEIAAVATYVRTAWTNDAGPVDVGEVEDRR